MHGIWGDLVLRSFILYTNFPTIIILKTTRCHVEAVFHAPIGRFNFHSRFQTCNRRRSVNSRNWIFGWDFVHAQISDQTFVDPSLRRCRVTNVKGVVIFIFTGIYSYRCNLKQTLHCKRNFAWEICFITIGNNVVFCIFWHVQKSLVLLFTTTNVTLSRTFTITFHMFPTEITKANSLFFQSIESLLNC